MVKEYIKLKVYKTIHFLKMDELIVKCNNDILRKFIPRHTNYKQNDVHFVEVSENLKIKIDRSDYTQWRIFSGGIKINPILSKVLSKNKVVVFDIGANIGAFSIFLIDKLKPNKADLHFFEPNPFLYKTLRDNILHLEKSSNGFKSFLNTIALGEKIGKSCFKIKNAHSGASSLVVDFSENYIDVDVEINSLDNYVRQKNIGHIDLLKIDVESFEPAVFAGSINTIIKDKPVLYFECSNSWFKHFSQDYIFKNFYLMESNGYKFYIEGKRDNREVSISQLKDIEFANIIGLVPQHIEKIDDINKYF